MLKRSYALSSADIKKATEDKKDEPTIKDLLKVDAEKVMLCIRLEKEINDLLKIEEKERIRQSGGVIYGDLKFYAYLLKEINDRKKIINFNLHPQAQVLFEYKFPYQDGLQIFNGLYPYNGDLVSTAEGVKTRKKTLPDTIENLPETYMRDLYPENKYQSYYYNNTLYERRSGISGFASVVKKYGKRSRRRSYKKRINKKLKRKSKKNIGW